MRLRRLFKMTHINKVFDEITILLLHTIVILEFSFQGEHSLLGCLKVVRGTCLRFERQTNSDAAIMSNIGRCVVMLHTLRIFFGRRLHSRNLFNFPEASKIQFHCNLKGLILVGTHLGQRSSDHPVKDRLATVKPMSLSPFVQKEILVYIRAQEQLNGPLVDGSFRRLMLHFSLISIVSR